MPDYSLINLNLMANLGRFSGHYGGGESIMNRIVFVLGGARSGKSTFAEALALQIRRSGGYKTNIAYIATGVESDEEFAERIRHHREQRNSNFKTYEENIEIAEILGNVYQKHHIFILECLTTWLGNLFVKMENNKIEEFVSINLNKINKIFEDDRFENKFNEVIEKTLLNYENCSWKHSPGELCNPKLEDKTLIVISNEIGQGIVPGDQVSRFFRDIHGRMNRKMANFADFVYFIIAGIPVRLA
jgi:adenosylcobinamide kinase/adenosylcobinamide-phosphate guanylyltransferase